MMGEIVENLERGRYRVVVQVQKDLAKRKKEELEALLEKLMLEQEMLEDRLFGAYKKYHEAIEQRDQDILRSQNQPDAPIIAELVKLKK